MMNTGITRSDFLSREIERDSNEYNLSSNADADMSPYIYVLCNIIVMLYGGGDLSAPINGEENESSHEFLVNFPALIK